MEALFACTKCHSRHPFDELSSGKQLCKSCRSDFPVVKCTYCRAEFQHEDKNGTSSICKKCAHNVKHYGKPKACDYCNIIAAFIGNKCQRCANCEKRYGQPVACEQCKQQCAFDRKDGSRKKFDGKLLCWLCTMSYKRVLAKTKPPPQQKSNSSNSTPSGPPNISLSGSGERPSPAERLSGAAGSQVKSSLPSSGSASGKHHKPHHHRHQHHDGHRERKASGSKTGHCKVHGSGKDKEDTSSSGKKHERDKDKDPASSSSSTSSLKQKADTSDNRSKDSEGRASSAKKPKLDKTSNGITQSKSSLDPLSDYSVSDNVIALTQLHEEVETLKKHLQQKEQQILDRDKKLTELKAKNWEAEKEMRNKIQSIQKQHEKAVEALQEKNRELLKQVATLSKSNKTSSSAS